jgi:hypothetical protein
MLANARSRSASLTSVTWLNLASALRTCEASVIGSLRERGNAKAVPGKALICAASSRPCSPGCVGRQLALSLDVLIFDFLLASWLGAARCPQIQSGLSVTHPIVPECANERTHAPIPWCRSFSHAVFKWELPPHSRKLAGGARIASSKCGPAQKGRRLLSITDTFVQLTALQIFCLI